MSLKGEDITLSVSSFFNVMYMYTLCDEMSYLIPCANFGHPNIDFILPSDPLIKVYP